MGQEKGREDQAAVMPLPLVSQRRAAELLGGISVRTLEAWRLVGRGPKFVRIGRRAFYAPEDLRDYIERNKRSSTSGEAA